MLDQMFGHKFVENTFFKGLSMDCVAQLMKTCKQVQVNAGENIYNTNQISNGSRLCIKNSLPDLIWQSELHLEEEHQLQNVRIGLILWRN